MAKIVWIASYPRSGNTWIRFLLANLLYGRVPSSAALNKAIPDIHRALSGGQLYGRNNLLIKTHWRFDPKLPLREDTIGVVYVLRNPLDVMVSNLDYNLVRSPQFASATAEMRQDLRRRWIENYLAHGGLAVWRRQGFGTWTENVESWTSALLPYPRLVLRYEDLRAEPAANLAKIARFLGLGPDTARIAEAVEHSSFAAMRAMEEREIRNREPGIFYSALIEAGISEGHRFVRRGEAGGEHDLLPAQRRAALELFAPIMARFGYAGEPAQAAPAVEA